MRGPLKAPIKAICLRIFCSLSGIFNICLCFLPKCWSSLVSKSCFFNFSTQNHAESFGNYLKKSALDPKRAKLNQKSEFGHVRTCQGQSRRTSPCQQSVFCSLFLFFKNYIFPILLANLSFFLKSCLLFNKFMIFWQNHVFYNSNA